MRGERPGAELTRGAASPDETGQSGQELHREARKGAPIPSLEKKEKNKKKKNFQLWFPGQQQDEKII